MANDLIDRNRRAIRDFLDGTLVNDKAQVISGLDPDVVFRLPRPTMADKTISGAQNVTDFIVDLGRAAYAKRHATYGSFVVDEGHAAVEWRLQGELARGGDYDQYYCWLFDLSDGRITEIREYIDTHYGLSKNAEVGGKAIATHQDR